MTTVYPHESHKKMSPAEYKYIRKDILKVTQREFKEDIIHKGWDRQSAYENGRSNIPHLVAKVLRLLVAYRRLQLDYAKLLPEEEGDNG